MSRRMLLDLLAVVFILGGLGGLTTVAFIVNPLAGAAFVSVFCVVVGVALGRTSNRGD